MIHVSNPIDEPADFDTDCRKKGNDWLANNPNVNTKQYPSYWRDFCDDLETGFKERCGWQAIKIPSGTVDHYISKKSDKNLTYEWDNYRYCGSRFNSSKKNKDDKILDPFEVKDDWFEVILPSCQLVQTTNIPTSVCQTRVTETINILNNISVKRSRMRYYQNYKDGIIDIAALEYYAPQVAAAVEALLNSGKPLP